MSSQNQGSHPTWKTWNFVFFFQAWKMPGICSKSSKNLKFSNSMFQASLFKMSFTKIILIYFFVKSTLSTLSTQTLIRSQIDLGFHCSYLEITWKIHGILCHKRSGNPASVLTHFEIFISKICMKVSGIWHKKLLKAWNLGPKTLRKTWNLVFGKKWEP